MSAKCGRLEARITVPAGGWAVSWTDPNGTGTATVPAGNYYPLTLAAELQTQIRALAGGIGDGVTVAVSDGETGTGKCSVQPGVGASGPLNWTSTAIRDALGFTANITADDFSNAPNSTVSGAQHVRGLWLPGAVKYSMYGDAPNGTLVTDFRATVGPTGVVNSAYGNKHRRHVGVRWVGVPAARAMAHHESVVNESFESFILDVMTNRFSYIPVGPYIRLYWDADVDGTYAVGRILWPATFDLATMVRGWTGRYVVDLPQLVVEA